MSPQEIKSQCEQLYNVIKEAQDKLYELRNLCQHEEVFVGNYMVSDHSIVKGIICNHCNKFLNDITADVFS